MLIVAFFLSCTKRLYKAKGFEEKVKTHRTIAILPFNVLYSGEDDGQYNEQELSSLKTWESLAFQKEFYTALASQSGGSKNDIKIKILHPDTSNYKLFGAHETNPYQKLPNAKEICKTLGVDALVYIRILKTRLLADTDTFLLGKPLSASLIQKVNPPTSQLNKNKPQIPGNAARSFSIYALGKLVNCADSLIIWQTEFDTYTEWNDNAHHVINKVCKGLAKKFPYRKGPYGAN